MQVFGHSPNRTAGSYHAEPSKALNFSGKQKHTVSPKLQPGDLIDLDNTKLLPGFTQRDAFDSAKMHIDDLVLCHLTNYLHPDNKIPSNLESGNYIRPTVHFSLNHPVGKNNMGENWDGKKYGILTPLKDALKLNGKPAGCLEVDTFWDKGVSYRSPSSLLLVQDESLPDGKAKVKSPEKINLPENSPVTVLATKQLPHEAMKRLIPKMGFSLLEPGFVTWGDRAEDEYLVADAFNTKNSSQRADFKRFLRKNHFKEYFHDTSPYKKFEISVALTQFLAQTRSDKWEFSTRDTPEYKLFLEKLNKFFPYIPVSEIAELESKSIDVKQGILDLLNDAKKELPPEKRTKLHLNQLIAIIKEAKTPFDSESSIKQLYKIASISDPNIKVDREDRKITIWFTMLLSNLLPLPTQRKNIEGTHVNIVSDIPFNLEAHIKKFKILNTNHQEAESHSANPQSEPRSWAEVVKTGLKP